MQKLLLAFTICFFNCALINAQSSLPPIDKSPLDESYCPANYPVLKIQDKLGDPLLARVIYSRPQKNGRKIFGELIEYGKVWRLGANEATEIEFYQNVIMGDAKIKKGRYTLYAIPDTGKWTIIVSKENDTWGSFRYDTKKDVARINVPAQTQTEITEALTIFFDKADKSYQLQFYWDNVKVSVPVAISL